MRKNLRTSSAGSVPRATVVQSHRSKQCRGGTPGALSMKMGAFVSVATALTLALVLPAGAQVGGPATLSSTLTSTLTTQVLNLTTSVTQSGPSLFKWTFVLSNPSGNTVQIRSFTAAPNCDLSGATNITDPPGWTHELFAFSPQQDPTLENNKVNWLVPATGSRSVWLMPGHAFQFSFMLNRGADLTFRGHAGALDTFGFSGDTLGCPPPPQAVSGVPPPGLPVRQHGPFYLAEAYPAVVQSYPAPVVSGTSQTPAQAQAGVSGISPNNCFLNGTTQTPAPAADAVPGILCLAKGVTQIFNNPFAICDSTMGETNPRVQAVHLSKIIPGSFKCDAYGMPRVDLTTGAISPSQTLSQDALHLRTWWTLRYTQPGTKFVLDVVVVCTGPTGAPTFHIDRWVWIVVADVRTLPFVVDLLHQDSIGAGTHGTGPFEIPCILAEDVASNLRTMIADFTTAVGQNNQNNIFNGLIDLEAYIALNCLMTEVAVPEVIFPGAGVNTYQPPGNQAVIDTVFGTGRPFGILDTTENPCCCKLLVDLEFMGQQLGISFGPHTFVNGAPV
jgi:hypothetical protein